MENVLGIDGKTALHFEYVGTANNTHPPQYYKAITDIRGSVTNLIDTNGILVKTYEYDVFGELTSPQTDVIFQNEVTFAGSIRDQSTGLQYMNARFYNPKTARFLTQDTYSGNPYDPWTQHLYAYCGNNPVSMIDPTGHAYMDVNDPTTLIDPPRKQKPVSAYQHPGSAKTNLTSQVSTLSASTQKYMQGIGYSDKELQGVKMNKESKGEIIIKFNEGNSLNKIIVKAGESRASIAIASRVSSEPYQVSDEDLLYNYPHAGRDVQLAFHLLYDELGYKSNFYDLSDTTNEHKMHLYMNGTWNSIFNIHTYQSGIIYPSSGDEYIMQHFFKPPRYDEFKERLS